MKNKIEISPPPHIGCVRYRPPRRVVEIRHPTEIKGAHMPFVKFFSIKKIICSMISSISNINIDFTYNTSLLSPNEKIYKNLIDNGSESLCNI